MSDGILIVGANGMIGSQLAGWARRASAIWTGTCRKPETGVKDRILPFDLQNDSDIERLSLRPCVTYLCAAETNIRRCEENPQQARRINVEQTVKLARKLHEAGSAIVFLSTNLVFDGGTPLIAPGAAYSPTTTYGRLKAEAEQRLLGTLERVAIVRLTKVVHPRFALFKDWLAALERQQVIRPFSDMRFSPIDLDMVTEELWALSREFKRGLFQLSANEDISYEQAAQLLIRCRNRNPALVQPWTAAEAGYCQPFARNTTLQFSPVTAGRPVPDARAVLEAIFRSVGFAD